MIRRKQQQTSHSDSNSGFTIIESLVAIVVVSILLAAIAPVIVLSTATRVQAKRIELASQAAKTFIDGVITGSITTPDVVDTLSVPTTGSPRNITATPGDYLVNTTKMPAPTSATGLYCLRKDNVISNISTDCADINNINFFVQAGRIEVVSAGINDGYRLAIRVYRGDVAFGNSSNPILVSQGNTKNQASVMTGGLGNKQAPLVEMTTDVSTRFTSFQAFCKRLGAAPGRTCQ
ncbi:hormogonium polysaccharide secretion pseudopilin HpsB [Anabaena cylindrica UHCC 0172]|uniref:hormogonium polysaccharide secretion pseudopilin HpsB n=1 Tax=Anabaena cylindrica TaxID=1165 RepID=UPI002B21E1E9|nr:hormogonium polysaccharide secretion pseudopilin HpsB [Anabaena cylindrica]MEA5551287.1 hormogonium polysaccharide secretion pseudopilin HpsB [Anabaena cylindrica UHCC 0172]